jgi:membrane protein DedA with SNARE-associated domain
MQEWLISIYTAHNYEIYAIIMVVGLFEGPFVSMVCGAVLALGFLSFWPVYIALMLGDLIGDVVWYNIGFHFGDKFLTRFGKYFGITERHVERVKNVFQVRKYSLLFLSKISNGLGFALAVLFSAGMSRVPFLQFMGINTLGQLVWSGVLIAIGFFFGDLYLKINSIMGRISLVFLAAVVIFAALRYVKYLQKKID